MSVPLAPSLSIALNEFRCVDQSPFRSLARVVGYRFRSQSCGVDGDISPRCKEWGQSGFTTGLLGSPTEESNPLPSRVVAAPLNPMNRKLRTNLTAIS